MMPFHLIFTDLLPTSIRFHGSPVELPKRKHWSVKVYQWPLPAGHVAYWCQDEPYAALAHVSERVLEITIEVRVTQNWLEETFLHRDDSFVGQAGGAERLVSLQLGPQESTWRLPAWRFVLIAVFLGVIGTYPVKTLPEGVHHFRGGTSPDLGLCLQIAWCSCLFYLKDLKLSITCLSSCT